MLISKVLYKHWCNLGHLARKWTIGDKKHIKSLTSSITALTGRHRKDTISCAAGLPFLYLRHHSFIYCGKSQITHCGKRVQNAANGLPLRVIHRKGRKLVSMATIQSNWVYNIAVQKPTKYCQLAGKPTAITSQSTSCHSFSWCSTEDYKEWICSNQYW